MLKDIGKSYNFSPSRIDAITNDHIIRIVSGSNILQGPILFGLFHRQLQQVESIIQREILTFVLQVKCIELGLGFPQSYFHLTGLEHLIRMIRTNAQSQSTIYNVLTQPKSKTHGTFFGLFFANRIII